MAIDPRIKRLFPKGSLQHKVAKKLVTRLHDRRPRIATSVSYREWIQDVEQKSLSPIAEYSYNPLISIVIPAYNTPDKYLNPLIDSILAQTYTNWELCLVEGGSTDPKRADAIRQAVKRDKRIKLVEVTANEGISGNTNAGIAAAKGEYIAFADHDDTLAPFALREVVARLQADRKIDLFYSDEDMLSDDGRERSLPIFKPDWSPDLLHAVNYTAHFVVVRAPMVRKLKGIRKAYDGAQDYDFILRLSDLNPKVCHIPCISYHWRMAEGSTAGNVNQKSYANTAGQRALADYVRRNNIEADVVEVKDRPTNYRLRYKLTNNPKVSIIIPFKDKVEYLQRLLSSIKSTTYSNYEIILVSNNSIEPETQQYLETLKDQKNIRILEYDKVFNYSAINNFGRKHATGDLLLFLNNDMEVQNSDWLEELAGVALQPEIGAVGGWLFYPDGTTQHAGVVLGMKIMAGHVFRHHRPGSITEYRIPDWPRNYLAVTGACLIVKATVFDEVGGFDEGFIVSGSDVALCLRISEAGYRNVFWPYARLTHYESVSVINYHGIQGDYDLSLKYYQPYLNGNDPYFNVNLDLNNEQIGLRSSIDD